MKLRTILQITAGLIFLGIIVGYSLYQTRDYQAGPRVTIETPEDGATTTEPLITVNGTAERIAFLSMNGRQIFTDRDGNFTEKLPLTAGYNIITVSARDTFDREVQAQARVILHASSSLLFSSYNNLNNEQETRRQENIEAEE